MPLSRFSVLEASGDVATRYCGRLFARMGAKVQRVVNGDDTQLGYAAQAGEAFGRWLDQDKRLLAGGEAPQNGVDLVIGGQDTAGVEVAKAALAALPGRATLLAIRWFDPNGPYGEWTGSDEIIQALCGLTFGFGEAGEAPMVAQGHVPQIVAGVCAFNAALAALLYPVDRRPGRVDVSVFEASICFAEPGALGSFALGNVSPHRLGINRFAPTYPASSYATQDGWVGVTALTPAQWASLCGIIERPDLARDPRFAQTVQRLMNSAELDETLIPAFKTRTTDEWVTLGQSGRIPITPMPTPAQMPDFPHWSGRNAFAAIGDGDVRGPDLPFRFAFSGALKPRWTQARGDGPLSGVRVIDFGMGWAGPLAARTLADLGADVIKIESFSHQDWWRGWEAGDTDPTPRETKFSFISVNRNKRGICVDLTTLEGLAQAKALIAGADLVLENYAAGVMDKMGLSQAAMRALNPALVSVSMAAFGNGGPLTGLRAYGSTVEQASGLPFVNGEGHWPPCLQHVAFGDPVAGLFGAAAALAGLAGRESKGGADIDLAQVQCLFQLGADAMVAAQLDPELPRTGRNRARLALCTVTPAEGEEAWLTVAVKPEDLAKLAIALGRPATEGSEALREPLAAWAALRPADQAAALLQAAGVAASPVQPASHLCLDEHLIATDFWQWLVRDYVGEHPNGATPFRYDGVRPPLRTPAPLLGEHTDEVLAELEAAL